MGVEISESMGVESEEGEEWFEIIGEKLRRETGDPKSKFYLIQTIMYVWKIIVFRTLQFFLYWIYLEQQV